MDDLRLLADNDDFDIDSILLERRPRKRVKKSNDEILKNLESEYLTPSNTFSTAWLNKLQKCEFTHHGNILANILQTMGRPTGLLPALQPGTHNVADYHPLHP